MLTVGMQREARMRVDARDSATLVFPLVPDVLASARMIGFAEATCAALMADYLAAGETSVGVGFEFTHEAATPIGMEVRVVAHVAEVDRRRCVFEIEIYDAADRISKGRHERFIVDHARFMERVHAKAEAAALAKG